jgi:hypothetical protein
MSTTSTPPAHAESLSAARVKTREGDGAMYATAATLKRRFDNVSDMWLFRRIRDDGFPAPVHFGTPQRYWRMTDVIAWERAAIERGCPSSNRKALRP